MSDQCDLFTPKDFQDQILAAHLPQGGVFDAARVDGSNFNNLLKGLGEELFRLEVEIFNVCVELDPRQTIELLPDWERSVGIPDSCFTTTVSLRERRQQVLMKLSGFRVQTEQDFIDLAAIFDIVVEIEPGAIRGAYSMVYPGLYLGGAKNSRFTMIVHFPNIAKISYSHPYPYLYGQTTGIIECLIRRLAPANVQVFFSYETHKPVT